MSVRKDLGMVTAYAYAVSKGYAGTEEEFATLMASYADVGQAAVNAALAAKASEDAAKASETASKASETAAATSAGAAATSAQTATQAAQTATTKAGEATTAATTATEKAAEAAQSATEAAGSATTAGTAATNAQAAQTAAEAAQTAAETAQGAAEDAAESVEGKAAQIDQNTSDISLLKSHLQAMSELESGVFSPSWEVGLYNGNTGAKSDSTTRIRTASVITAEYHALKVDIDDEYKYVLFWYDESGTFIGRSPWIYTSNTFLPTSAEKKVNVVVAKADDSTASVEFASHIQLSWTFAIANDVVDHTDQLEAAVEKVVSPNLINFDDPDFMTGKYMDTGSIYTSATYNTSGYIPVESGKTYTFYHDQTAGYGTPTIRFLSAFDSAKNTIASACTSNVHSYTVPSGIAYIVISTHAEIFNLAKHAMLYEGTSIDQYYPYFAPYYALKVGDIDYRVIQYVDDQIDDVRQYVDAKIEILSNDHTLTVKASAASMASGSTLTAVQNVDCKKNHVIEFWGAFSAFTSLTVGHGGAVAYGNYAVIDDTNVTVYYGANSQQMAQQAHGLTISDFIHVVITQNSEAMAKIQITTATGEYTLTNCSWDACRGDVYATVGSAMTDCVYSSIYKDMAQDVFLFGNSYVGLTDTRYPYYLIKNGYDHFYLDGWGGRNSAQALISFNNVMGIAVPKYAVWALGMNDPDTSTAVNASWLSCVESFLSACENVGTVPILATIPNCPGQLNTFKNAWVKASGHRYIDFAKAVGAESAGATWYTGMLSSDNVHPTALGAKALYARFLTDVPEVIR